MGNDVVLPGDRQSLPEPFGPVRGHGLLLEDRAGAGDGLDLQSLLRILNEHRKLILAAMVVGLIAGLIVTLMTTKLYRADVTLEVNAPKVEILNEKDGGEAPMSNSWDFIATQVGLLKSRSLAVPTRAMASSSNELIKARLAARTARNSARMSVSVRVLARDVGT